MDLPYSGGGKGASRQLKETGPESSARATETAGQLRVKDRSPAPQQRGRWKLSAARADVVIPITWRPQTGPTAESIMVPLLSPVFNALFHRGHIS